MAFNTSLFMETLFHHKTVPVKIYQLEKASNFNIILCKYPAFGPKWNCHTYLHSTQSTTGNSLNSARAYTASVLHDIYPNHHEHLTQTTYLGRRLANCLYMYVIHIYYIFLFLSIMVKWFAEGFEPELLTLASSMYKSPSSCGFVSFRFCVNYMYSYNHVSSNVH